jgi:3-hydroxyisobutyrate dehydrogenase-like beta-hydroxyacid dehydrogenase
MNQPAHTGIRKVAFIGVGNMGAPMAWRVHKAGFDLMVCDRSDQALAPFQQAGVPVAENARACAQADVIVVLLANDAQVFDVLTGPDGLCHHIPAGHQPIVCMMGTTLPDTLQALEGPLTASGAILVDAPISGGIVGAQRGTLTIMMGGPVPVVQRLMPLMQSMGERIFHCGNLGAGEIVKVINNMICIANMFLTAEAIELGKKHGVSFETLSPILSVSTGLNFLTANAETGRAQYAAWARSPQAYTAIHDVVNKDLSLARKLADQAGINLGLLSQIADYVDSDDPLAMPRWVDSSQP